MTTSLVESEKEVQTVILKQIIPYLSCGAKIAKIGSVYPEIICRVLKKIKKKEITEGKNIARSASLAIGLNQGISGTVPTHP